MEMQKQKPKRMRADRIKVRCRCCQNEYNKDGIEDHFKRRHPTWHEGEKKWEEIVPKSQPKLTDFKTKSALEKYLSASKEETHTKPTMDLKSPGLVGAASKPKPKTFLSLPFTKPTFPKAEEVDKVTGKECDVSLEKVVEKKQGSQEDGEKAQKLLEDFNASVIRPVLEKLKTVTSVKDQQEILSTWEDKLKDFRELSVSKTPVNWNDGIRKSYKDRTVSESLKDKIGVAYAGAGGDCQFKAISVSLYGTEDFHSGLRLLLAKEIIENKDAIDAIARNAFSEIDSSSILTRVLSSGKQIGWGNETTKYIMSHILQRPIITTTTDCSLNKETAWKEFRNVKYNADEANINKKPIYLLLDAQHYDAILLKNEEESFVDIQKCQNMHPRLSKGYKYIEFGSASDKDLISEAELTRWKRASQWDEFNKLQDIKTAQLINEGKPFNEIQKILRENEKEFLHGLSEELKYKTTHVKTALETKLETDLDSNVKRKRSIDSSSSNVSPEHVFVQSPEKVICQEDFLSILSDTDTKMSFEEEKEAETRKSNLLENIIVEIKADVSETRKLLEKLVLDNSRKPLNPENVASSRDDTINFEYVASVDALLGTCPWLVQYREDTAKDADFSGLRCSLCYIEGSTKKDGQFSYCSTEGTDFTDQIQPQRFRNLKNNVKGHMLNARHRELAKMGTTHNKLSEKQRQQKTGMILGSYAYEAIKNDHSYDSYEGKVAAAASRGEDVGDLNHSKFFCRKVSDSFFKTLQETLRTKLEHTLPGTKRRTSYASLADKYTATETRSAGQIVGMISFVDGKIVDAMVEDRRVTNWTGAALAKDIVSSISTLIPEEIQKQRCVGGCFDGQYLHDKVHKFLMKEMPGEEADKCLWYSYEWDPAHLIERGIGDAKKELPSSSNMSKVHKVVYQVNKMFTSGKSYVEMQETAEVHEQRLYAPIQSSPTRFANNEHKALLNFKRNYNLVRDQFAEENIIQQIDHFGFVAALNFQIDLYQEISKLSGNVQQAGRPGWRIETNVKQTFDTIREMVDSLPDSEITDFSLSKNLPNLAEAVKEMQDQQTFRGVSVTFSKLKTRSLREGTGESKTSDISTALGQIKKDATKFLETFENGYYDRKTKYKDTASGHTANLAEAAFSLDNMVTNSENKHVPEEFMEYFHLSKRVGFMETDLDDMEVKQQYRRLTYFVKEEYDKAIAIRAALAEDQEVLEKRIYENVFNSHHEDEMDVAADLYLSALLRTRAESVVESMGSIVKAVSEHRPNLDFEQLSRDAFTCYNGPEIYAADAPIFIKESINRYFVDNTQSGELHFHRKTTQLSKLEDWSISEVVDKKRKEAAAKSKISFSKN